MMRLLLVGLFGYATYRLAREFIRSVPSDFEPVDLPPPTNPVADPEAKRTTTHRGRVRK